MDLKKHKSNLNILHIIVGLGDGGAEASLFKLISSDKINNHVVISLSDFGKYGDLFSKINIPTYALNFKRNRLNFIKLKKLLKIVKKHDPKIIQSWMYHADFITSIVKIFFPKKKIIWGIRNTTYKFKDSVSRYLICKICSYLSHLIPNLIISCSEKASKDHIRIGYSKKKIEVIYNGVDLNKFKEKNINVLDQNKIKFPQLNHKKPSIGMVARYDQQKGHKILLESLFILKQKKIDFNCYLVGSNIDQNNLELTSIIKKYNLASNIFLLGQIPETDFVYNILDVSILSSINGEGFPNVLIESMACSTPCVATNIGDASYIIEKTGWIAKPGDSASLANELEKAILEINHPNWLTRKENCRQRVKMNFDIVHMLNKFQLTWSRIS